MASKSRPAYDSIEAAARKDGPNVQKGLSTEGLFVAPMTDERLWDARMAVTFVNLHPERFSAEYGELGPITDVFRALGLADVSAPEPEPPAVKPGPLTVACPRCESPPGARCVTDKGVGISKTHVARQPQTDTEES